MQQQPQVNSGNVRSSNQVRRARHPYSPELYRPVEPTQEEIDTRWEERLMREERRRLAVSTQCHKVILLIDQPHPPRVFPPNDAPPPQWATMRVSWRARGIPPASTKRHYAGLVDQPCHCCQSKSFGPLMVDLGLGELKAKGCPFA